MLQGKSRTRALHSGHAQDEEEEREKGRGTITKRCVCDCAMYTGCLPLAPPLALLADHGCMLLSFGRHFFIANRDQKPPAATDGR